jgi:alpha-tubulin suppressor-like RCC1 family protein
MGDNDSNQLAVGKKERYTKPKVVTALQGIHITDIAAGCSFSLALSCMYFYFTAHVSS